MWKHEHNIYTYVPFSGFRRMDTFGLSASENPSKRGNSCIRCLTMLHRYMNVVQSFLERSEGQGLEKKKLQSREDALTLKHVVYVEHQ